MKVSEIIRMLQQPGVSPDDEVVLNTLDGPHNPIFMDVCNTEGRWRHVATFYSMPNEDDIPRYKFN